VKPYFERGWCFCESSWAAMVKHYMLVLDLGKDAGEEQFYAYYCFQGRKAPVLPEEFVAQLVCKGFTNGNTDTPLVVRLYREGFEARFGVATKLLYIGLGWGDEEARAVARVLLRAPALEALHLENNSIGAEGARALAEALPHAPALKLLDLDNNSIGDEGARALAEALPHAPALQVLSLVSNSIGDAGACALAEALPRAPALEELSLFDNSIGDKGARALAEALLHAPALEKLGLRFNLIGGEAKAALRTAWGTRGGVYVYDDGRLLAHLGPGLGWAY